MEADVFTKAAIYPKRYFDDLMLNFKIENRRKSPQRLSNLGFLAPVNLNQNSSKAFKTLDANPSKDSYSKVRLNTKELLAPSDLDQLNKSVDVSLHQTTFYQPGT